MVNSLKDGILSRRLKNGREILNYTETNRQLKVRSGEHIGISPLTFRKTKGERNL